MIISETYFSRKIQTFFLESAMGLGEMLLGILARVKLNRLLHIKFWVLLGSCFDSSGK